MVAKHVVIVGAGLGGLATALRCAHAGARVTVLEKTGQVGGRNRRVQVGGCDFDGGPTLLMMRRPFEKLFEDVGENIEDHLQISLCQPSYRAFWRDGTRLDGSPNVAEMIAQMKQIGAHRDADRYAGFLGRLGELYREAMPNFVERNFDSPLDFASPRQLGVVMRHRMLGNLARRIEREIEDPRLRMLFSFQTMYLGLSPFDAPWVYAVLTYMEYGEGIWYPQGGLPRVSEAVAELAARRGAEIRLNAAVARVEGRRVVLESGETIEGDAVVVNADLPYSREHLLPPQRRPRSLENSCSALVLYCPYHGDLPGLLHHNVFFGRDFRQNLDQIFHRHEVPDDPAFYACVSSKTDPNRAPAGWNNLFVLIPCANLQRPWTPEDRHTLVDRAFTRLECETGFDRAQIRGMTATTPQDWQSELNLWQGAAFGISHVFRQSAFLRPNNRSHVPGVYYVGASTVPGNGLPMVLISADLAAQRLRHDGVL